MLTSELIAAYWSTPEIVTNVVILLHLAGALGLGLLVGYERSYHGRAAGMRTYGLVCMASCALTIVGGYPGFWFGGTYAEAGALWREASPIFHVGRDTPPMLFIGSGQARFSVLSAMYPGRGE